MHQRTVSTTVFFKLDTQIMMVKVTNLVDSGPSRIVTQKKNQTEVYTNNES